MTKKRPPYFIYLLVFILLLLGASLYVWRQEITSFFFSRNLKVETNTGTISPGNSEVASLEILRDPRIKSLEKQVKVFNYNDLVKSQDLIMDQTPIISTPSPDEDGAPIISRPSRVRIGNSNPFVKKDRR